jgi:hypothetical protein
MAKKPEPPKPLVWSIYKIAAKAVWLGPKAKSPEVISSGACRITFVLPAVMSVYRLVTVKKYY